MPSTFHQIQTSMAGLPDVEEGRPSTVRDIIPEVGMTTTTVSMLRQNEHDEDDKIVGARFYGFVQQIEDYGNGPVAVQVVLPDKALRALVRQWERLNSRSRPLARERARERALEHPAGFMAARVLDDESHLRSRGDVVDF